MKVLLLGSGGREHALAWKIAQSAKVEKLFIAPGNAGTQNVGENVDIKADDFEALKNFVVENGVDMVIVGPEDPLVKGVYDDFKNDERTKNVPVIGPSKAGAVLEGSKDFAKQFMKRHNIPTAKYETFDGTTVEEGLKFLETLKAPYDSARQVSASGPAVTARAPDPPEETLKVGDSGQKIRILSQILEFLAQFLPEITPSGLTDTFDDALETTVRSAQQTLGRTVTGKVTPADWLAFYRAALSLGAVNPASAAPEPQEVWPGAALTLGSSGPAVLQVQQWLNEIAAQDCSASFVPETGEFDTATQTALEAWQIVNNITPLGVVDDSVWKQLKADANIS